tara:strand:- start:23 stop:271 length:249 start_codon:yes stop_codon:yes gene_type:complete
MSEKRYNNLITEYQRLYNADLMNETLWYSKKEHAKVVFRKCMKSGRLKCAQKIAYHYDLNETGNSDTVIALGLAILNQNKDE